MIKILNLPMFTAVFALSACSMLSSPEPEPQPEPQPRSNAEAVRGNAGAAMQDMDSILQGGQGTMGAQNQNPAPQNPAPVPVPAPQPAPQPQSTTSDLNFGGQFASSRPSWLGDQNNAGLNASKYLAVVGTSTFSGNQSRDAEEAKNSGYRSIAGRFETQIQSVFESLNQQVIRSSPTGNVGSSRYSASSQTRSAVDETLSDVQAVQYYIDRPNRIVYALCVLNIETFGQKLVSDYNSNQASVNSNYQQAQNEMVSNDRFGALSYLYKCWGNILTANAILAKLRVIGKANLVAPSEAEVGKIVAEINEIASSIKFVMRFYLDKRENGTTTPIDSEGRSLGTNFVNAIKAQNMDCATVRGALFDWTHESWDRALATDVQAGLQGQGNYLIVAKVTAELSSTQRLPGGNSLYAWRSTGEAVVYAIEDNMNAVARASFEMDDSTKKVDPVSDRARGAAAQAGAERLTSALMAQLVPVTQS
ncbi:MAG: LPP20 family lipoprotein [Planctomycetes bacterium]|nr:LPP20 family lipoprotein [Planctomycetota bacterium]